MFDKEITKGKLMEDKELRNEILLQKEEITYLKRMVDKYRYDNLTGLKLRTDFEDDFFKRFQDREKFCLILIDLDKLKDINTNLGYIEGDKAIRSVGHYLSDNIKGECYRIGGDEFAVISYNCIKGCLDKLNNISYVKVKSDYKKHTATKCMFEEADELLHKIKEEKNGTK